MEKSICKVYVFDKDLTDDVIDDIEGNYDNEMNVVGVYSPIYFIDLGKYGTYTQINKIEDGTVSHNESVIVQYGYVKENDSDIFVIRRATGWGPVLGELLYDGVPSYREDEAGNRYFLPSKDILHLC